MAIYGKRARGLMARHFIQNRLSQPESLKLFEAEGYFFSEKLSKGDEWIFTRG